MGARAVAASERGREREGAPTALPLTRDVLPPWAEVAEYRGLLDAVRRGTREIELGGLPAPALITLGLALHRDLGRPVVFLTADWPSAESARDAASAWLGGGPVHAFPPREFLPYAVVAQSPEIHADRLRTLAALVGTATPPPVLVLPVTALKRQLVAPALFATATLHLGVGGTTDPLALARGLARAGYERQALVEGPGTFSVRGGIVDVFPLTADAPCRVELAGDTIDSIRTFAADTQRSIESLDEVTIPPAREVPAPEGAALDAALGRIRASLRGMLGRFPADAEEPRARLRDQVEDDLLALREGTAPGRWEPYLPLAEAPRSVLSYLGGLEGPPGARVTAAARPVCLVLDAGGTLRTLAELARHEEERLAGFLEEGRILPEQAQSFGLPLDWRLDMGQGAVLYADALGRSLPGIQPQERLVIPGRQAPPFAGQWTLVLEELRRWRKAGYRVACWAGGGARAERLAAEIADGGVPSAVGGGLAAGCVTVLPCALPAGFEVPALGLAVLGEGELHGRRPRPARLRRGGGAKLQTYEDLQVGDYVVHGAHGIGEYLGTAALTVGGKVRDYLVLRYEGTDRLYVPTEQVGLVQKYIGGEGRQPRVSRLGGGEWARAKERVKESVRRMAEELLALYAARQALQGHAFPPDTPWQRDFEDAFPYDETPDQLQAIAEIKADMERAVPMDRLLCGDVGYGKTEVAMRAAFKAVADGRQVAVLVPTTILAEQHLLTFTERFAGFPVQIGMLSRFRNRKEQEETVTALRRGTADIVIGTHRLLQEDIDFKNLGLLVVDEEHRFGVAHKERLKQLRQTVDVLTMTATPIPRTLQMAMAGIRDMSTITTPPENRYPIETVVVEWSPALVHEALTREFTRRGQVYYLHNRVQSIGGALERVAALAPGADIALAHGQMPEEELEAVMTEFWRGEHQVLLATTIIESGLDIPNANTLIVEDADKLGLAQLYQIRGRVGRSSRVAYAYFTYRRERALTEVAAKRLSAIKEFTELGSGFRIAMRDMEIRGAGNILGAEQHGFVASVGFDLYAQLLEEAVRELRGERLAPQSRVTVELRVDAFLEDAYMAESRVKLEFYKKIHAAASEEEVAAVDAELRDRFGPYPSAVHSLLRLARLRVLAQGLGLLGVVQEGRGLLLTFPNYASTLLPALQGMAGRFGRRLRVEGGPKPVLRLALDAEDDATVLASAEGCLQGLAAHPQVRAWKERLAESVAAGEAAELAAAMVRPRTPPQRDLRVPPPRVPRPGAETATPGRHREDRLARSAGLVRVEAAPDRALAPPQPAGPAAARPGPSLGRPLRAAAPPGLALPGGGRSAGPQPRPGEPTGGFKHRPERRGGRGR